MLYLEYKGMALLIIALLALLLFPLLASSIIIVLAGQGPHRPVWSWMRFRDPGRTQRLQYPLIREYSLNLIRDPTII